MISNSVTHLQSYTNTAIAENSGNSARLPTSNAVISASSANIVASNDECFMMFHNVLKVFHDLLLMVHNVLRSITMFYMCFMMFNNVLCLASRRTIGDRTAVDRLRDSDNAAACRIGDNSAGIGDNSAEIVDIAATVIRR